VAGENKNNKISCHCRARITSSSDQSGVGLLKTKSHGLEYVRGRHIHCEALQAKIINNVQLLAYVNIPVKQPEVLAIFYQQTHSNKDKD
jgi:hypothetical protein